MIKISKSERNNLKRVGLLKDRRIGMNGQDANYTVANREHVGRDKTIYVTEEPEIMLFLGHYENLNLQKINAKQYKQLVDKGILNGNNTQFWGTFVPNAVAFEDSTGGWRCKKVTKIMLELGLWSNSKSRRAATKKAEEEDVSFVDGI